jgi:excisionase family DNA binding protein
MNKLAYSFKEFCVLHNLSRTKLYDLLKHGEGPETMAIGKRHRLISIEAAKAWREKMTNKLQQGVRQT